jgi:hypothetical protein
MDEAPPFRVGPLTVERADVLALVRARADVAGAVVLLRGRLDACDRRELPFFSAISVPLGGWECR